MDNFGMLYHYELKKLSQRKLTWAVLLVLAAFMAYSAWPNHGPGGLNASLTDQNGDTISRHVSEEFMMGVAQEFHHAADANFDGFQDFGYLFCAGNQPNYWSWWLWDEEQGQFQYYAPLIEVSQPVFDAERQVVTGWARNSAASGVHTIYRWVDGELTLLRRIETHYPADDNTQLATVEDLIDGQMVVVYQKEWDLTTINEGTPLADWSWYDLAYHGEAH